MDRGGDGDHPEGVSGFQTIRLLGVPVELAPDGSQVRVLPRMSAASMIHIELGAGRVSRAVAHRTVEEIWYVVSGRGEMWRRRGAHEETIDLVPGVSLTIPVGTHFQFRASREEPICIVAVTMPPWPGDEEADPVKGPW